MHESATFGKIIGLIVPFGKQLIAQAVAGDSFFLKRYPIIYLKPWRCAMCLHLHQDYISICGSRCSLDTLKVILLILDGVAKYWIKGVTGMIINLSMCIEY